MVPEPLPPPPPADTGESRWPPFHLKSDLQPPHLGLIPEPGQTSLNRAAGEGLRLAYVCSEYPPALHGGIGSFTRSLGRKLAQRGHAVRVVGIYPGLRPGAMPENDQGVLVWRLGGLARRLGWIWNRFVLYRTVARWAARGEVDLIEVPDWLGEAAGWPRLAAPVIMRLHGSASYFSHEMKRRLDRLTFLLERSNARRADFYCSVSRYTARETQALFGLSKPPEAILYNGVEAGGSPAPIARSKDQVVYTGTLTEKKGVLSLVRAWPQVARKHPSARLHLYGKDTRTASGESMQARLESLLGNDLRPKVIFHGHVTRAVLDQALGEARVGVFPSYAESFGLAPVEAMAVGCPVIFSRRTSGPEVVQDGEDGLLVDPENPESIAGAITRLLEDDALAERLSRKGREKAERAFSLDSLVVQNESFYRECLRAYAGSHPSATRRLH